MKKKSPARVRNGKNSVLGQQMIKHKKELKALGKKLAKDAKSPAKRKRSKSTKLRRSKRLMTRAGRSPARRRRRSRAGRSPARRRRRSRAGSKYRSKSKKSRKSKKSKKSRKSRKSKKSCKK